MYSQMYTGRPENLNWKEILEQNVKFNKTYSRVISNLQHFVKPESIQNRMMKRVTLRRPLLYRRTVVLPRSWTFEAKDSGIVNTNVIFRCASGGLFVDGRDY